MKISGGISPARGSRVDSAGGWVGDDIHGDYILFSCNQLIYLNEQSQGIKGSTCTHLR